MSKTCFTGYEGLSPGLKLPGIEGTWCRLAQHLPADTDALRSQPDTCFHGAGQRSSWQQRTS